MMAMLMVIQNGPIEERRYFIPPMPPPTLKQRRPEFIEPTPHAQYELRYAGRTPYYKFKGYV